MLWKQILLPPFLCLLQQFCNRLSNPETRSRCRSGFSRPSNRNAFGLRASDLVRISDFGIRVQHSTFNFQRSTFRDSAKARRRKPSRLNVECRAFSAGSGLHSTNVDSLGVGDGWFERAYGLTVILDQFMPCLVAKAAKTFSLSIRMARTTAESSAWPYSTLESGMRSIWRWA